MKEITGELWSYYGKTGYCTVCSAPFPDTPETNLCAKRHIAIESVVEDTKFVVCITTNGTIRKDGQAVMGRGCAWEATQREPGIQGQLGKFIHDYGNVPGVICEASDAWGGTIISFPVKHNWWEQADLKLIERSAMWLATHAKLSPEITFILPRPGCGNGRLTWEQVKPVIEFLPDNVWVISKGATS